MISVWQRVVLCPAHPCGAVAGLVPGDDVVALAEALALAEVDLALLVVAHDEVHAPGHERRRCPVGAEAAVGHERVALAQVPEQACEEAALVHPVVALGRRDPRAALQAEEPDDLHEREAAAGLLPVLWVLRLVLWRVGHRHAGAIDRERPAAGHARAEVFRDVCHHPVQQAHREAEAGITIGLRLAGWQGQPAHGEEGLDIADSLPARTPRD